MMQSVAACWQYICSLLRQDHNLGDWHSRLTDPDTATLLRKQDHNVAQLQTQLQDFSATGQTFGSVITFLTTQICTVGEDEILFTYIRAVLEVFILYSISTSDFAWMDDSRAIYIERQTELMSQLTFSPQFRVPYRSDFINTEDCLLMATLIRTKSCREHLRSEIIKRIVYVSREMSFLHEQFEVYKHNCHSHQRNSAAFIQRIKPIGHYWIAMAYCLAIEPVVNEPPPSYNELYTNETLHL